MSPESKLDEVDNEIGKIENKNGVYFLTFYSIVAKSGKSFSEIHSGNTNPVVLPISLPKYSFLRD